MKNINGTTNLLILFAAIGLIAFMFIASTAQFQSGIFASLYPKKASLAAEVKEAATIPDYCSSCAADLNRDGEVNQSDLDAVMSCDGKSAFGTACLNADLDKNAKVDYKDQSCVSRLLNTACTQNKKP